MTEQQQHYPIAITLRYMSTDVAHLIDEERLHQITKFGGYARASWHEALLILAEELGEVARAILQNSGEPAIKKEVLQLATISAAILDDDLHYGDIP